MEEKKFNIYIEKALFDNLFDNKTTEYHDKEQTKIKSIKLLGQWVDTFREQINKSEKSDFRLKGKIE